MFFFSSCQQIFHRIRSQRKVQLVVHWTGNFFQSGRSTRCVTVRYRIVKKCLNNATVSTPGALIPYTFRHFEINTRLGALFVLPLPYFFFYLFILERSKFWAEFLMQIHNHFRVTP